MVYMTMNECIAAIVQDIEKRKNVDYGDSRSVRRFNAAYNRITKHIRYIEEHFPDQMDLFFQLMYHPDPYVAYNCCCRIASSVECENRYKKEAISVIKKLVNEGKVPRLEQIGIDVALKRWEEAASGQGTL